MRCRANSSVRSGSSAKTALVLYQYTAPAARPHLTAAPFQLRLLPAEGVVEANRRPPDEIVVCLEAFATRGDSRKAGLNMATADYSRSSGIKRK